MRIDKIKMANFRGKSSEIELGDRTFISGRNGIGKSTILNVPAFVIKGKLPDCKSSESFMNASDSYMMGGITMGGHDIERTLTQGASLKEKLIIDTEEMSAKAAEPMLKVLIGKGPAIMDMPAFYACSARDKRIMALKCTATKEEQDAIFSETEKARTAANEATADRHAAEKALELATEQVSEIERPVGSVAESQIEEGGLNKGLDELTQKMSDGEANDKLKEQYKEDAGGLEDSIKAEGRLEGEMVALRTTIESTEKGIAENKEPVRLEDVDPITDNQRIEIQTVLDILDRMNDTDAIEAIDILEGLLPDPHGMEAHKKLHVAWNTKHDELERIMAKAKSDLGDTAQALQSAKDGVRLGKAAATKLAQVGPSLDKADIAIKAGMIDRRTALREKISELQKIETMEKSMEGHRVSIQKRGDEEKKAKAQQAIALKKQSDMIGKAVKVLSDRSKAILPDGELDIRDDGKNFDVIWMREDGRQTHRTTLSGGEQGLFDSALGHSLAPEAAVFIEAGEVDHIKLPDLFDRLKDCEFQIIVASWFNPKLIDKDYKVPESWTHIEME